MSKVEMNWFPVGTLPNIGEIKKIQVGNKKMCLINDQGQIYATGVRCPHAGADLSHGWCQEAKIICPVHRQQFDLASGKGDEGQGNFIPVYPLKIIEGKHYVGVKVTWWKRLFS